MATAPPRKHANAINLLLLLGPLFFHDERSPSPCQLSVLLLVTLFAGPARETPQKSGSRLHDSLDSPLRLKTGNYGYLSPHQVKFSNLTQVAAPRSRLRSWCPVIPEMSLRCTLSRVCGFWTRWYHISTFMRWRVRHA